MEPCGALQMVEFRRNNKYILFQTQICSLTKEIEKCEKHKAKRESAAKLERNMRRTMRRKATIHNFLESNQALGMWVERISALKL